jgi:hypothetical protein
MQGDKLRRDWHLEKEHLCVEHPRQMTPYQRPTAKQNKSKCKLDLLRAFR